MRQLRINRNIVGALAVCCFGLLTACHTHRFPAQSLAFVQIGQTTRPEVIDNFGLPDYELVDSQVMGYLWKTIEGRRVGPHYHRRYRRSMSRMERRDVDQEEDVLCFQLNGTGQVIRFEEITIEPGQTAEATLTEWSGKGYRKP